MKVEINKIIRPLNDWMDDMVRTGSRVGEIFDKYNDDRPDQWTPEQFKGYAIVMSHISDVTEMATKYINYLRDEQKYGEATEAENSEFIRKINYWLSDLCDAKIKFTAFIERYDGHDGGKKWNEEKEVELEFARINIGMQINRTEALIRYANKLEKGEK